MNSLSILLWKRNFEYNTDPFPSQQCPIYLAQLVGVLQHLVFLVLLLQNKLSINNYFKGTVLYTRSKFVNVPFGLHLANLS